MDNMGSEGEKPTGQPASVAVLRGKGPCAEVRGSVARQFSENAAGSSPVTPASVSQESAQRHRVHAREQ